MKYAPLVLRVLAGLPMIIFGLNKYLHFMEMPPPIEGSLAAGYMGTLFGTYLWQLVAITEIGGGLLMLSKKTSLFAAIILMPVLINIIAYHLFVDGDMAGMVTGLVFMIFTLGVMYFNKERIAPIFGDQGAA